LIEGSLRIVAISLKGELSRAVEVASTGGLVVTGEGEATEGKRFNFDTRILMKAKSQCLSFLQ